MIEKKKFKIPKMTGKKITENDMDRYDWSKKIFMGVTKKWVYYKVLLKKTGEYEKVKLFYDRMKDWEFEHEKD